MLTAPQQAGWYYSRRRQRLHRAKLVVMLQPRVVTIDHTASTVAATFMSGVTVLDNKEGVTTLNALSGANAADFQLSGHNLQLKAGAVLTAGVPKVVVVNASNTKKGSASHTFTLTVT